MSEGHKSYLVSFLRDASIIITGLTAYAYLLGYTYYSIYWKFVGLKNNIRPDVGVENVLLQGGLILIVVVSSLIGTYYFWLFLSRKRKPRPDLNKSSLPWLSKIHECVLVLLLCSLLLCYVSAWAKSKNFGNNASKIESIFLSSREVIANPTELTFLGRMGPYLLLRRVVGTKTGEIILISDNHVTHLTLR